MINNIPFFRFPFYGRPQSYSQNIYYPSNSITKNHHVHHHNSQKPTEISEIEKSEQNNTENQEEKNSPKYSSIGPILLNINGFSNKEEPLLVFSGFKLYLDDIIILALLFFLYKEDVKDDILFILLILLLIT